MDNTSINMTSSGALDDKDSNKDILDNKCSVDNKDSLDGGLEAKRKALENALGCVSSLIDDFENVIRKNFDNPTHTANADFSIAVKKVYPDPVIPKTSLLKKDNSCDDTRLHMSFDALQRECISCSRCNLCKTRKNTVFGEGCTKDPIVMVIGEGPGETEDNTGRPFVGNAGQFLDKWLNAIELDRNTNVFITNIVKCRPPQNRDPLPEEKNACLPFLKQQIALIQPQAILCLGKPASTLMTQMQDASMASLHGRFFFYDGVPMLCTYHPAAVLRDLSLKRPVWEDLKKLARYLGIAGSIVTT